MLLIRSAVDYWSGLLDAPEVGATGAMVVHGGVGTKQRGRCQRETLGTGGRIRRPGERTPVRFGHWLHEYLAWAVEFRILTIGHLPPALRDGFRQAQERTVNLVGPLLGRVAEGRAERVLRRPCYHCGLMSNRRDRTRSTAGRRVAWRRSRRGPISLCCLDCSKTSYSGCRLNSAGL